MIKVSLEEKKEMVKKIARLQVKIFKEFGHKNFNHRMVERVAMGIKFRTTYGRALDEFKKNTDNISLRKEIEEVSRETEIIKDLNFGIRINFKYTEEEDRLYNTYESELVRSI